MKKLRSFLCLVLIGVVLFGTLSVSAGGDWCKFFIKQTSVSHPYGCTVCTFQNILQNSGTLKSEYQITGTMTSRTDAYVKYDKVFVDYGVAGYASGSKCYDVLYHGKFANMANTELCVSGANWKEWTRSVGLTGGDAKLRPDSTSILVGIGSKDFLDMTVDEVVTSMKILWNSGVWASASVQYDHNKKHNSGSGKYIANHTVMFAGVDDSDVYFNDSSPGGISSFRTKYNYANESSGYWRLSYMILFKNDLTTPASVAGGTAPVVSEEDMRSFSSLGIDATAVSGGYVGSTFASTDLAAYCKLTEMNYSELLDSADLENLGQTDLEAVDMWRENIDSDKSENGFISVLRWIVSLVGVLFTVWALLVYLAFWFDHVNSFFYMDLLHILTLGQLHICPRGEKPTFKLGKDVKEKTVNHAQILGICLTAIFFGAILISGIYYVILAKLVNLILGWVYG